MYQVHCKRTDQRQTNSFRIILRKAALFTANALTGACASLCQNTQLPSEELAPKLEASREAPHAAATSVRHAEEATGMWLPGGLFISGTPDKLLGGRWMMPPGH